MMRQLSLSEAYDRWAEVYPATPHNPLMQAEQGALLALLGDVRGRDVLDLACGSGRYGAIAQAAGASSVVGVDRSVSMLTRAKLAMRARGDLTQLPLQADAFDLVICGLALGHAANLSACAQEIARVLRIGGSLLYSDFHDEAWRAGLTRSFKDAQGNGVTLPRDGYPPAQHRAALLAAGFEVEQMRELRVGIEFTEHFANSAEFYQRHHGVPLLLVVRARKRS
jgi:ubiquinone/menaquinone biosynthesis C-methylase UbiE